jgi:hypothetical protein
MIVLLCCAVAGCRTSNVLEPVPPFVTLITTATAFDPGSVVAIIIANHSPQTLLYGECSGLVLQNLTTKGWRDVPLPRNCADLEHGIAPGEQKQIWLALPVDTPRGSYRVRFRHIYVLLSGSNEQGLVPQEQLITNTFTVR